VQHYALTGKISDVSNYGGYGDIETALNYVYQKGNNGALVVLVSDFIYGLKSEKILKLVSKKFDFISVMVRDPRDMSLPPGGGEVILEDPYSGSTLLINPDSMKDEYAKKVNSDIDELKIMLRKYGADFLFLETDKPFVKDIVKFFNMRAAKWR